jgi:hypothetical protein
LNVQNDLLTVILDPKTIVIVVATT